MDVLKKQQQQISKWRDRKVTELHLRYSGNICEVGWFGWIHRIILWRDVSGVYQ